MLIRMGRTAEVHSCEGVHVLGYAYMRQEGCSILLTREAALSFHQTDTMVGFRLGSVFHDHSMCKVLLTVGSLFKSQF